MLCAFCSAFAMDAQGVEIVDFGSKESLSRAMSRIKKEISRKKKNGEDTTADMEKFFELGRRMDFLGKVLIKPGKEVRESVFFVFFLALWSLVGWLNSLTEFLTVACFPNRC